MNVLDGKVIADEIKAQVLQQAETYRQRGVVPTLAIVVATDDPSTAWYVKSIGKQAAACQIEARLLELAPTSTTAEIAQTLSNLANDSSVHGIILQTPLPEGVNIDDLLGLIPPAKDIDGANPLSAGNLVYGTPAFPPATAAAVMKILDYYRVELTGKPVVVVGRSRIVGKPVAHLLLERDATVTVCHSKTANLAAHTTQAEVLVVAAGKAGLISAEHVKPGAVVIDVGTNVNDAGQLVGDVDTSVESVADALTPVPGGVGPVTTALILQHTLTSVGPMVPSEQ